MRNLTLILTFLTVLGATTVAAERGFAAPATSATTREVPTLDDFHLASMTLNQGADAWRYRWHNNQWWYWSPNNAWLTWNGNAWSPYTGYSAGVYASPYVTGYRGNYPRAYSYPGGYYGRGYYGRGYYGRDYYRRGYYGYGRRWRY